jgi:hypothetical protein
VTWVGGIREPMVAFQALETGLGAGFLAWERPRNQLSPCRESTADQTLGLDSTADQTPCRESIADQTLGLDSTADQTLGCSASQTRKASMAQVCLVELKPARQAPESGKQSGV